MSDPKVCLAQQQNTDARKRLLEVIDGASSYGLPQDACDRQANRIADALEREGLLRVEPQGATVWLIEWPEDDNVPVRWWNPAHGWMRDANEALHFARKTDADCFLSTMRFGLNLRVTEHKFCSAAEKNTNDFEHWAQAWMNTCNTMLEMIGLPGHGSPDEMIAQVQHYLDQRSFATSKIPLKLVYIKRFRTLMEISEPYADQIREALAEPNAPSPAGKESLPDWKQDQADTSVMPRKPLPAATELHIAPEIVADLDKEVGELRQQVIELEAQRDALNGDVHRLGGLADTIRTKTTESAEDLGAWLHDYDYYGEDHEPNADCVNQYLAMARSLLAKYEVRRKA